MLFFTLLVPFSDRLSAMDVLTIGKVMEYAYQKVYGDGGKVDKDGEKINCKSCLEILCMNQVSVYYYSTSKVLISIFHDVP